MLETPKDFVDFILLLYCIDAHYSEMSVDAFLFSRSERFLKTKFDQVILGETKGGWTRYGEYAAGAIKGKCSKSVHKLSIASAAKWERTLW